MASVYAHCPHCTFPVVVPAGEERAGRYCRQCRRLFVPADGVDPQTAATSAGRQKKSRRNRMTWRTLLQRRPPQSAESKE